MRYLGIILIAAGLAAAYFIITARFATTGLTIMFAAAPLSAAPVPAPDPDSGMAAGRICYPSSETPPMTLYLQNRANDRVTQIAIERGRRTFIARLPAGEYVAYAHTAGMGLRGAHTCAGSERLCPFQIETGRVTSVNLCGGWDSTPGPKPAGPEQAPTDVMVRLLQNMHARSGPHLSEPEIGLLEAGTLLPAVGRTVDMEWVLVRYPELNVEGWLHAPLTQILGDANLLPVVAEDRSTGAVSERFVPAIWRSEENRGIVLFKGEIRNGAGQPVNGFSILLDNGTWSVLSHPTGASHHYPDVIDGRWDVVIDNETDAAGWWTMTVVRYECPDFETGFNAQCKQFTPLSETKVIRVVHPDENIIEANWTCLKACDQGLYVKPYRKPVAPIRDNFLLYVEDRALKSSPPSPVFNRPELRTIYDELPETPDGLKAYLAEHRPSLSPDGRFLIVDSPAGVTWLADLVGGELRELSRPPVPAAWSPDSRQIAYLKNDALYLFDISTNEAARIWQQPELKAAAVAWPLWIMVKSDTAAWMVSPTTEEAIELSLEAATTEPAALDRIAQKLPPTAAWALSHDRGQVAFSIPVGGPLQNMIYIFDLATQTEMRVGPINGYRVPEIRWTADDDLLLIGATNPKFPSSGAIFTMAPEPDTLPEILLESDTAYLVDVFAGPAAIGD